MRGLDKNEIKGAGTQLIFYECQEQELEKRYNQYKHKHLALYDWQDVHKALRDKQFLRKLLRVSN